MMWRTDRTTIMGNNSVQRGELFCPDNGDANMTSSSEVGLWIAKPLREAGGAYIVGGCWSKQIQGKGSFFPNPSGKRLMSLS